MIIFTVHALKRMQERSITRAEVTATLRKPDLTVLEEKDLMVFRKVYGIKTLEVISEVRKLKFIVITAYWI